jgi:hypothetical protein
METTIDPNVFDSCIKCGDLRNQCACIPCDGCGLIEFCICDEYDVDNLCLCDNSGHSVYDIMICDCPCAKCIGDRLDFQERITLGFVPLPFCLCELTFNGQDQKGCHCTCDKCFSGCGVIGSWVG